MGKRILAALTIAAFVWTQVTWVPAGWAHEGEVHTDPGIITDVASTTDPAAQQLQTMQAQASAMNPVVPTAAATPLPIITDADGYRYYRTPHDKIPDFGARATIRAARSGLFSDPGMWVGNRLPGTEDIVRIDQGLEVTLNASATVKTLAIYGRVDVRDNVTLTAGTIFVAPEGALYVGTPTDPRDNVRFVLGGLGRQPGDPGYYGDGLVALGRLSVYGVPMSKTFIRFSQEPRAGQTTLVLSEAPVGWRAGDTVFLADTRELTTVERWPENATRQGEYVTLVAVNGNVLTLTAPLQYDHLGGGIRNAAGMPEILPHVATLTRRVVFTSRDPSGSHRAHLLGTHRVNLDIQYAGVENMGRLHRQSGLRWEDSQELRQALHATHHNIGPAAPRSDGYQYTLVGNSIYNTVSHNENQGGFMLHDSHYGLVRDNVVTGQNNLGFIAGWSANESHNLIDGNFVGDVRYVDSFSPLGDESGAGHDASEWAAFLTRAPNNTFTNNVVAGNQVSGVYATVKYVGEGLIPAFRGADPSVPGQGLLRNFNAMPFSLGRMEVYSSYGGLQLWWVGATGLVSLAPVEISGFKGWNNTAYHIYGYNNGPARIVNPWIRGDAQRLMDEAGFGIYQNDAYFGRFHITGADIQGMAAAVALIGNPDGWYSTIKSAVYTQLIENSSIRNNLIGVYATNFATNWASAIAGLPQRTIIRNVDFGKEGLIEGLLPQVDISAKFMDQAGTQNAVQKHEVLVYDYNREAGNNFRVHFDESLEGRLVPQGTFIEGFPEMSLVGSPEANLTNEENLIKYGLANAGDIVLLRNARRSPPRIQGVVTDLGHVWDTELGVAFPTPATTRLTFTATNPPAGLDLRALQALLYVTPTSGTPLHTAVPMNYGGNGQWTLDLPGIRLDKEHFAWVRLIDPSKGVVKGQHASTGMLTISPGWMPPATEPPAEEPPVDIVPPPDPEPVTPPAPAPEPTPEPAPEESILPVPETEPAPEPAPMIDPAPAPEPAPEPELTPEPAPAEGEIEPVPTPSEEEQVVTEPMVAEPAPEEEPGTTPTPEENILPVRELTPEPIMEPEPAPVGPAPIVDEPLESTQAAIDADPNALLDVMIDAFGATGATGEEIADLELWLAELLALWASDQDPTLVIRDTERVQE